MDGRSGEKKKTVGEIYVPKVKKYREKTTEIGKTPNPKKLTNWPISQQPPPSHCH